MATYRDFEVDRQFCAKLPSASHPDCTDKFAIATTACSSFNTAYEAAKSKEEAYLRALEELKKWDNFKTQTDKSIAECIALIETLDTRILGVQKAIDVLRGMLGKAGLDSGQIAQINNNLVLNEQYMNDLAVLINSQKLSLEALNSSLNDYNTVKSASDNAKVASDESLVNLSATSKSADVSSKVSAYLDCVSASPTLVEIKDTKNKQDQNANVPYWTYLPKTYYGTIGTELTITTTPSNIGPNTQMSLSYNGLPSEMKGFGVADQNTITRNETQKIDYYISGTPLAAGTYTVTITAANPPRITGTTTLTIVISEVNSTSGYSGYSGLTSGYIGSS